MITIDKLNKLYSVFGKREEVSRQEILLTVKEWELGVLCKQGYIELLANNKFRVLKGADDLDKLFAECVWYLQRGDEDAEKIFLECYVKDPMYLERLFCFIYDCSCNGKDFLIFRCFKIILSLKDEKYNRDIRFYLYILNYLTTFPEELKPLIDGLIYEDVSISENDSRYSNIDTMNILRSNTLNGDSYTTCFKQCTTIWDFVNNEFFRRYRENFVKFNSPLIFWLRERSFKEIISWIELEGKKRNLSKGVMLLKAVVKCLLDIENGVFPVVSDEPASNEYDAFYVGNFQLCYDLRRERKYSAKKKKRVDYILLFLDEIIKKIHENEEKTKINFNNICTKLFSVTPENPADLFEMIWKYLNSINKGKYYFLIITLIEIGWLEETHDSTFFVPLYILSKLGDENNEYTFDIDFFVKKLYEALEDELDSSVASKYLFILQKAKEIGIPVSDEIINSASDAIQKKNSEINTNSVGEDYNYGIVNLDFLIREIEIVAQREDIGIEEACLRLKIDNETMNLIRLIYARYCHICGNKKLEKDLINAVARSKDKSKKVKDALMGYSKQKNLGVTVVGLKIGKSLKP